jgi:hypothetical protein
MLLLSLLHTADISLSDTVHDTNRSLIVRDLEGRSRDTAVTDDGDCAGSL